MSVPNPAAGAASPGTSPQGNNGEPGSDPAANEVLEKLAATVEGLAGSISKIEERQGHFSAFMRRAKEEPKQPAEAPQPGPAPAAEGNEPAGDERLNARIRELEAKSAAQEQERQELDADTVFLALQSALIERGVDAAQAKDYAELHTARNRDSLRVFRNESGRRSPGWEEYEGAPIRPIGEYVTAFLETDSGRALLPAKPAPTDGGRRSGSPPRDGVKYVSCAEMLELTPEQQQSGEYALR